MGDEPDLSGFDEVIREMYSGADTKLAGVPLSGTHQGNGFHGAPFRDDPAGADIAVLGCSYDLGTTYRSGARFGPKHLREFGRYVGAWESGVWPWVDDVRNRQTIVDLGDVAFSAGYWESFRDAAMARVAEVMDAGAGLLALGGDHFVTYPLAKAVAEKHGPLAIVHFDSHTDDLPSPLHNHGTMFFHGVVEGWIDPKASCHLGIRSPHDHSRALGYTIFDATYIHEHSSAQIAADVKALAGDRPAYVTFDIDFVDPAFAPGTGTPVPGGPDSYKSREILFEFDNVGLNVVAADLVEVAPLYDGPGDITSLLGATLASDMLTLIGNTRIRNRTTR
jgi:agmatinase